MVEARNSYGDSLSMTRHLRRWGREGRNEWLTLWRRIEPVVWPIIAAFPLFKLRPAVWPERRHLHPWKRLWVLASPNLLPKYLGLFALAAFGVLLSQIPHLTALIGAIWPKPESLEAGALAADARVETFRDAAWSLSVAGGAAVAFFGLLLSAWRTSTQNRQAHVDRQRQETEAFTTAVEQLGSESFATRLGAIHNLEALARASPRLHEPIMETFCNYLQKKRSTQERFRDDVDELKNLVPERDLQTIATAIGRRKTPNERSNFQLALDSTNFSNFNLHNVDFCGFYLVGSYFCNADLQNARLDKTSLESTHFDSAKLQFATFKRSYLSKSKLSGTYLAHANFEYAKGDRIDFTRAEIAGTSFYGAKICDSKFYGCGVYAANFAKCDLSRSKFRNCDVLGNFRYANLCSVLFDDCIVSGCSFYGANLRESKFKNLRAFDNITARAAETENSTIGLQIEPLGEEREEN